MVNQQKVSTSRTPGASGWRALAGPLVLLAVLVAAGRLGGHYWQAIQEQVATMGAGGVVLFWLAQTALAICAFPASVLGFSAGAIFGWTGGLALSFSASLAAGMVMFLLGRGVMHDRVQDFIESRPTLRRLDVLARRQSLRFIILTRLAPFNYGLASYVLAAGRPPAAHYLAGLAGILPSTVVWVWLGSLAGRSSGADDGERGITWILAGVALFFLVLLSWQIGRLVRRALAGDGEASAADGGGDPDGFATGFWSEGGQAEGREIRSSHFTWEWDLQRGIFRLPSPFLATLGYGAVVSPVAGDWVENRVHPEDRAQLQALVVRHLRRRDPGLAAVFRFRRADGGYVWLQALAMATWGRHRKVNRFVGTVSDVTDFRRGIEERDLVFNLSPDLLCSGDFDGRLQQTNPAWVRVLGWSRSELEEAPLETWAHPDDASLVKDMLRQLASGEGVEDLECRWKTRGGQWRWLSWSALPFPGQERFFAVARDISRRKAYEDQILEYQTRLRNLTSQLSRLEDRQRQELATALHDGLAQILFAARAQLTLLGMPEKLPDPGAVLRQAQELVDQAMQETRSLSFELFPPALRDLGLGAAFQWLAEHFAQHRELLVEVDCPDEEPPLDEDLRRLLFQGVRELLTNVVKHARTDRAAIQLTFTARQVRIVVRDDGGGGSWADEWNASGENPEGGFGLFSIRERLLALDGSLEFVSVSGRGTVVTLRVPLPTGPGYTGEDS